PVNTAADMVVPCLSCPDVVGEVEGEAGLDGSPHVTGGGKGLRAAGGMLQPLVRGRVADRENIRLWASIPLSADAPPQLEPRGACGAKRMLCVEGTPCGVRGSCRQRGEDDRVKVPVPLQFRGDGLQLTGGGGEHVVDLIVDRAERFLERVPLFLSRRPCNEIRVPAPVDRSCRDEPLNLLVGGRVTLCCADRRCDLRAVR